MTQPDLIPFKPFSEVAQENLRRYAIAPVGARTKTLRANRDAVTAMLRAELNRGKIKVKGYRRVRKNAAEPGLLV